MGAIAGTTPADGAAGTVSANVGVLNAGQSTVLYFCVRIDPVPAVGQLKHQVIYRQPAGRKLIVQIRRITNQRDTGTGENIDNMALRTGARQPLKRRIDRHGAGAMTAAGVGYTKKDAGSSICAHIGLLGDFAVSMLASRQSPASGRCDL